MIEDNIYKRIKDVAKSKGITIKNLAENVGMTEQGLFAAMKKHTLRFDVLIKIGTYLNVNWFWLFAESIGLPITPQKYLLNVNENGEIVAKGAMFIDSNAFQELKNEIAFNAKIGKGLIFVEYDDIECKFVTAFENLKEPVKQEYLGQINSTWLFDRVVDSMEKDSKANKVDKKSKK